jgi:hypothetical protein
MTAHYRKSCFKCHHSSNMIFHKYHDDRAVYLWIAIYELVTMVYFVRSI